jgi:preprotein translocase subunit YajC
MGSTLWLIAQAAPAAAGSGSGGMLAFGVQMVLILAVFYFLLIRPQQKRAKQHAATIASVQKNDDVITAGGLMGKVFKVTDDHVEVEIAKGVIVKVVKSTLTHVESRIKNPAND